ncbi:MAG: hypothetical protein ABIR98_06935 [Usitatibacter sp.]
MNSTDRKPQDPSKSDTAKQQQAEGCEAQQYGEGNYKAARQYNEGMKEHVQNHDIEREARDAAPRTAAEEKEMEEAERIGRSKSRGEGASPDGDAGREDVDLEK